MLATQRAHDTSASQAYRSDTVTKQPSRMADGKYPHQAARSAAASTRHSAGLSARFQHPPRAAGPPPRAPVVAHHTQADSRTIATRGSCAAPTPAAAPNPAYALHRHAWRARTCGTTAVPPRYCRAPSGLIAQCTQRAGRPVAPHVASIRSCTGLARAGRVQHPHATRAPQGSRLRPGCAAPWLHAAGRRSAPCRARRQRLHPRPRHQSQALWRAPSPLRQLERRPRAAWTLRPPADQRWARQAAGQPQAGCQQLQAQPAGSERRRQAPRPAGPRKLLCSLAPPLRPGLRRLLQRPRCPVRPTATEGGFGPSSDVVGFAHLECAIQAPQAS